MCWTRRLGAPPAARHQSFAGVRAYTQNAAHFACTLWLLLKHPTNDPCLPLPVPAVGLLLPPCAPIATFARCLASPAITRRSPTAFHCLAFPKHKGGLLVATPCCGGSSGFYLKQLYIIPRMASQWHPLMSSTNVCSVTVHTCPFVSPTC